MFDNFGQQVAGEKNAYYITFAALQGMTLDKIRLEMGLRTWRKILQGAPRQNTNFVGVLSLGVCAGCWAVISGSIGVYFAVATVIYSAFYLGAKVYLIR